MKFYVYELVVEPDGTVCYVGKGSGQRMYKHRRYALQPPSKTQAYLYRSLSELLASGKDFKPRKVFETENELEALSEEKRRIKHYGIENLFNWGDIHTGPLACQIKEARREAMRKARHEHVAKLQREHGYKMPPEVAAKISAAHLGKHKSPEAVARVSASKKGKPLTTAHRAALTGVTKTRGPNWRPPTLGMKFSEATCRKKSESIRKWKQAHQPPYRLISPTNQETTIPAGTLLNFCQQNNLHYISIWRVLKGRRQHHKNWRKSCSS